jgi:hypothetical protein
MPLPHYPSSAMIRLSKIRVRKLKINKIILKIHERETYVHWESKV